MGKGILKNMLEWFGRTSNDTATPPEPDMFSEYKALRSIPKSAPLCLAPWSAISFTIDGVANICCLNRKTAVSIVDKTIDEIWSSEEFEALRKSVTNQDLEHDCVFCLQQFQAKNYAGVKARNYDIYYNPEIQRPQVMEFCLENTCNLACTMCNSVLSSTIRKNQKLPPLAKRYGPKFVAELEPYIPYLKEAIFAGGEPFFIPIYFDIWEKMLAINPDITISIVTNGTVLNDRIKALLERGNFKINVSLESSDKEVYESIRCNANWDEVLQNFEWFTAYGERKNLQVNIPTCPLTTNWHTLPDMVRFANKHNVSINFVYIERPYSLSLVHAPRELLDEILAQFGKEQFDQSTDLYKNNAKQFQGLVKDIEEWREHSKAATAPSRSNEEWLALWKALIMDSPDVEDENVKLELFEKIAIALQDIPEDRQAALYETMRNISIVRIIDFINEKKANSDGLKVIFKELAG